MATYWGDYWNDCGDSITSAEFDAESVAELVEWMEHEFSEEMGGELIDLGRLSVAALA